MDLNTNQQKAVTCDLNPTIVIAGPGAGKTHLIINRINYMISKLGCKPGNILVTTFSKKAAEEMEGRFRASFNESRVKFGTLHRVFYQILRSVDKDKYSTNNLMDEGDKKKIIKSIMQELRLMNNDKTIDEFLSALSYMTNELLELKDFYPKEMSKEDFDEIYKRYILKKQASGKHDFDDILVDTYYLLLNNEEVRYQYQNLYKYILVDEFQDINKVQFMALDLLIGDNKHIFVVGDDDQSIYGFRGAKPNYLLNFKEIYENANEIYLHVSYRCSKQILNYSLKLINHNKTRYQKNLTTPNPEGERPNIIKCMDAADEAKQVLDAIMQRKGQGVPYSDIAVIYRTNVQAGKIIETLVANNIPLVVKDYSGSLLDHFITRDILAYLYIAHGYESTELYERIINKPKRYVSKAQLSAVKNDRNPDPNLSFIDRLIAYNEGEEWKSRNLVELQYDLERLKKKSLVEAIYYIIDRIGYKEYLKDYAQYIHASIDNLCDTLYEVVESADGHATPFEWVDTMRQAKEQVLRKKSEDEDSVVLMTMHASKGLQFDTVFILDVNKDIIPFKKAQTTDEIEEERRLMYVAMTRAKKKLNIYLVKRRLGKILEPSIFIDEIKDNVFKEMFLNDSNQDNADTATEYAISNTGIEDVSSNDLQSRSNHINSISEKKQKGFSLFRNKEKTKTNKEVKIDINKDKVINHVKYGTGKIVNIEDDILQIMFENGEVKSLAKTYCLQNDIISWED